MGSKPYMHPIVLAMAAVVLVLALLPPGATEDYLAHNELLLDLLMVAVVAFAVPLVDNVRTVLRDLLRVCAVVLVAGAFITVSTVALCYVAGVDADAIAAFSLRSVTNPIAIAVSEQNAISVDLAMLGVFVTGLVNVVAVEPILHRMRITDQRHVGLVLGITAHALGIARALEIGSLAAAYATVGMITTGLMFAFATPWLLRLLPL
jgi:putative effector of murein hydrolase